MKTICFVLISLAYSTECAPIVNGFARPIEPNLGAFPFHASLMELLNDKRTFHSFCGGSLIHPGWVLTAAHCIRLDAKSPALKPSEAYVALGSVWRSARGAQVRHVDRLVIHPKYLSTGRHDVGLVRLRTPATLCKNVIPVKLYNGKESLLGEIAYLTGFGIINDFYQEPERLRKAILHISNYDKCFGTAEYEKTEICAASTVAEGKACKGDSGGPLFIVKNGNSIQVGITSHLAVLPLCRVSFNNSVYTRISAYIAWISKVTGIDFTRYHP